MKDKQIESHLNRIRVIEANLKDNDDNAKLITEVFLRRTGAIRLDDGSYRIDQQAIESFFRRYDSSKKFTQYDKYETNPDPFNHPHCSCGEWECK